MTTLEDVEANEGVKRKGRTLVRILRVGWCRASSLQCTANPHKAMNASLLLMPWSNGVQVVVMFLAEKSKIAKIKSKVLYNHGCSILPIPIYQLIIHHKEF